LNNPTNSAATNHVEPRGLALTKIYPVFPQYPLVDKVIHWTDTAGEHVVTLPSDPSLPPLERQPWFQGSPLVTTTGLLLTLGGQAGSTNQLQTSTNLSAWQPLIELVIGTNGYVQYVDSLNLSSAPRFYRAVRE